MSAEERLRAAEQTLSALAGNPPAVQLGGTHDADLAEANREFLAWQMETLKQRASLPPEAARLFYRKTFVPPPFPQAGSDKEPPRMKMDLPLVVDPTGLFSRYLKVSMGEPDVYVGLNAQAKAASVVGVAYRKGISYVAAEGRWKPSESLEVSASHGPDGLEGGLSYQLWAAESGSNPATGQLTFAVARTEASIGYDSEGRLSGAVLHKFAQTPEALSSLFEASVGVELAASAPTTVEGVTCESRASISRISASLAARVAAKLSGQVDCPHCATRGELTCSTCRDVRTIVCTACGGKLTFTCKRCGGGGTLYCSSCINHSGRARCWSCSGSGQRRCYACSGSGHVTESEWVERTYQQLVVTQVGFDSSGQPIYERHYETRTRTELVPRTVTCGNCGGSGQGGTCTNCGGSGDVVCSRCAGSGIVGCGPCRGTGQIACSKCKATGRITCPECRGKPIVCPLCSGRKHLGGGS